MLIKFKHDETSHYLNNSFFIWVFHKCSSSECFMPSTAYYFPQTMFLWRLSSYINPAEGVFLLSKLFITQSYFKIAHAVHLRFILEHLILDTIVHMHFLSFLQGTRLLKPFKGYRHKRHFTFYFSYRCWRGLAKNLKEHFVTDLKGALHSVLAWRNLPSLKWSDCYVLQKLITNVLGPS